MTPETASQPYILEFEKPLRELETQLKRLHRMSEESKLDVANEIQAIEQKLEETQQNIYHSLTPWQRIQVARHPNRPYALDYIGRVFDHFEELHGDRRYRDDQAIIGGVAQFEGHPVMLIAQQKGRDTKENILRNFGCPDPEGYRKALRLMQMAEKFAMPIVTLVDTPGAYPGIGSEERHVAEAIAVNIREMSALRVPIVTVIIGEGGSGGALGIATSDTVLIFQHAYYSVISPEGCAAILWKDRAHAPQAAEALRITAEHLLELGIVDGILPEPLGGAHRNHDEAAATLKEALRGHLGELGQLDSETLRERRYAKFRAMGVFETEAAALAGSEED